MFLDNFPKIRFTITNITGFQTDFFMTYLTQHLHKHNISTYSEGQRREKSKMLKNRISDLVSLTWKLFWQLLKLPTYHRTARLCFSVLLCLTKLICLIFKATRPHGRFDAVKLYLFLLSTYFAVHPIVHTVTERVNAGYCNFSI